MPLDEKQRLKLAIAITGVLALVLVFMIWNEIRQISDLGKKVADAEKQIKSLQVEVVDVGELIAERAFLEQTLEEDIKILPNEREVANFFYIINRIKREARVNPNINSEPQEYSIIKPKKGSGLVPHTWKLSLTGELARLVKFINLFEVHERFFRVDGVTITEIRDDPVNRDMLLTVTTFTYNPKGQDAAK